jgi:TRAP-type uncharacterized transport system fused permease subunit
MTHFNLQFSSQLKLVSIIFISIFIFILSTVTTIHAQPLNNVCDPSYFGGGKSAICQGRGNNNSDVKTQARNIVNALNNFLIVIAPSIAVIAVLVGAFMILQQGLKVGIVIIQWALIGMVVALLSSGILSLILGFLL